MARSRSPLAHEKVLKAALDLFSERGIEATSMDAIAKISGVSKATIYNHWPDKEALLMEVMIMTHGLDRELDDVDTGDLQEDLTAILTNRLPGQFEAARARLTPSFIAYSAVHPEFGKAWRMRFTEPPRTRIKKVLQHGMQRGLLPRNLELDASVALLLGPMLYEHIFNKESRPKPLKIGPTAAAAFCRAFQIAGSDKRK